MKFENSNSVLSIPGLKSGDFRTFIIKLERKRLISHGQEKNRFYCV